MKFKLKNAALLAALAGVFATSGAIAASDGSSITIEQKNGSDNTVNVTQTNSSNGSASVLQDGSFNSANVTQGSSSANLSQLGDANTISLNQTDGQIADVNQVGGTGNTATIMQTNGSASVTVSQAGSSNMVTVRTSNIYSSDGSAQGAVTQIGDRNYVYQELYGNGIAITNQAGNDNWVIQDVGENRGNSNVSTIDQTGNGNYAAQYVWWSTSAVTLLQNGNGNKAIQIVENGTAALSQIGDYNFARQYGHANASGSNSQTGIANWALLFTKWYSFPTNNSASITQNSTATSGNAVDGSMASSSIFDLSGNPYGFGGGVNSAFVEQVGINADAIVAQDGMGNRAGVHQSGGSFAAQDQVSITQVGNNNTILAVQNSSTGGNRINVVQN